MYVWKMVSRPVVGLSLEQVTGLARRHRFRVRYRLLLHRILRMHLSPMWLFGVGIGIDVCLSKLKISVIPAHAERSMRLSQALRLVLTTLLQSMWRDPVKKKKTGSPVPVACIPVNRFSTVLHTAVGSDNSLILISRSIWNTAFVRCSFYLVMLLQRKQCLRNPLHALTPPRSPLQY